MLLFVLDSGAKLRLIAVILELAVLKSKNFP